MVKQTIVYFIGFIFWIISSFFLYPSLVQLIIKKGYPSIFNEFFFFSQYTIIGIGIGYFGKSRGWLLGLLFGIITALIFLVFALKSPIYIELNRSIVSIKPVLLNHFIFTLYSTIGGHFGELIRIKYRN